MYYNRLFDESSEQVVSESHSALLQAQEKVEATAQQNLLDMPLDPEEHWVVFPCTKQTLEWCRDEGRRSVGGHSQTMLSVGSIWATASSKSGAATRSIAELHVSSHISSWSFPTGVEVGSRQHLDWWHTKLRPSWSWNDKLKSCLGLFHSTLSRSWQAGDVWRAGSGHDFFCGIDKLYRVVNVKSEHRRDDPLWCPSGKKVRMSSLSLLHQSFFCHFSGSNQIIIDTQGETRKLPEEKHEGNTSSSSAMMEPLWVQRWTFQISSSLAVIQTTGPDTLWSLHRRFKIERNKLSQMEKSKWMTSKFEDERDLYVNSLDVDLISQEADEDLLVAVLCAQDESVGPWVRVLRSCRSWNDREIV